MGIIDCIIILIIVGVIIFIQIRKYIAQNKGEKLEVD